MLARFFKPKWQHQKADVRLRAIEKLSFDDPETGEILAQLALRDQDAEVRCAALNRSEDSDLLLQASQNDTVEQNRRVALQRVTHLVSGERGSLDEPQRQALIVHITSTELLVHLVLNANLPTLRHQALTHLNDETALLDIIRQSDNNEIRRDAAERIETQSLLEQLERDCRGKDKRLYRIARDKLQQYRELAQQREARQLRRTELAASLHQLANGEDFPQFGAKLDALNTEWQRFSDDASEAEQQNWLTLSAQCQQRREQQDQVRAAAAERAAAQAARQAEINSLLTALENAPDSNGLEQLSEQWQQLQPEADAHTRKQINHLLDTHRQALDAQHALGQQLDKLNALISEVDTGLNDAGPKKLRNWQKQSEKISRAINWPTTLPQPSVLKQLAKLQPLLQQARDHWQQKQDAHSQQIDALLDTLAGHIDAGEARQADRQHTLVQKQQNEFNTQQQHRYRTLFAQLQDLRDWQGYALTPKREALCEQMEALIDSTQPAEELAAEIRQLQQQWRELDHSGNVHSRNLWQRFKKASDQAYAPCDAHYAAQRELRQQNLQKREQMCEQLESYLAQVDWDNADWRVIEELSRTARNEWRQYSPVDRAPGKALQSRFNKQINTLDSRLKGQRKAVQQTKEALLEQSATLLTMDDVQQATHEAKQLQQQWREAGTTFRAQERKLWTEFRENCNQLFEKRNQSQQQVRQQQRQDQNRLRELCQQLETLLEQLYQQQDSDQQLAMLEQQYQALQSQDNDLNTGQQKQFEQLASQAHARLNLRKQLFGADYQTLKRQDQLCQQLEEQLIHEPDTDSSALVEQWQGLDRLNGQWQNRMDSRFEQARAAAVREDDELQIVDPDLLRELCIRLEIALGAPSPIEDEALRLEYQMQRLQQALRRQQDGYELEDIQQIVFERLSLPFHHHHTELNERFNQLLAGYNLN